jgi:formamidopyrimidine-DNA glycosylase
MIVFELAGKDYLLIHLKMTGQLIFISSQGKASGGGHPINFRNFNISEPNKFTIVILSFKGGAKLLFHDIRKFGWLKLVNAKYFAAAASKYGLDPLSVDFTFKNFQQILSSRPKLKIKQLLMMQEKIAGIGNIYADESLILSRILPTRLAGSLTNRETKKLRINIIKILRQSIKLGGTSVNTFVNPSGARGMFVEKLKVYQRGNKKCLRCDVLLKKIKLGGRGTVFCPNCQK